MQQKPIPEQIEENVQHAVEQEVTRSGNPWYVVSKRCRIFVAIYLIEFVLFTLLAWFVHVHPVLPVDVAITQEFQENKAPWLQTIMVAVSYLGNAPYVFAALILVTAAAFWAVRLRLEALFIVALPAVSSVLNVAIKLLVARPRPTAKLVEIFQHASGHSFPSGHVMSYVAFWGLLFSLGIILFKRDRWWHYVLLIVSALFVILVGPSRIYLGDHWASDVLGGYLFGSLLLGIGLWIYLKLKERGILTKKT
jgi:undecaprenyl-diphosphatase